MINRFRFLENHECDMDILKSILFNEKVGVDLEYLRILHFMTCSWTLAHENGEILFVGMESKVPFFGKLSG